MAPDGNFADAGTVRRWLRVAEVDAPCGLGRRNKREGGEFFADVLVERGAAFTKFEFQPLSRSFVGETIAVLLETLFRRAAELPRLLVVLGVGAGDGIGV